MNDRPPGAYILDEETGELKPDLNDAAMAIRHGLNQPINQSTSAPTGAEEEVTDEPGR